MSPRTDWNPVLREEFDKPYWSELQQFVQTERDRHTVYPGRDEVFAALHLTPLAEVKVLILGQDPYHGPGQAHGLCFSVRTGTRPPPSLQNIFTELHDDLGIERPATGDLTPWARQGVLLLNATLTVRAQPGGLAPGQGVGDVHRRGHPSGRRQTRTCGVHPLGQLGAPEASTHRHEPSRDHRVAAPVAPVGAPWLLRLQAVLPRQRRARRRGPRPGRLATLTHSRT